MTLAHIARAAGTAALLMAAAPVHAPAQPRRADAIRIDTVRAPQAAGPISTDPQTALVRVYLPPGYHTAPDRRYPVLYLLHGYGSNADRAWVQGNYQGFRIDRALDSLIAAGAVHEMIVVMPTANTAFGGSFYMDSPLTGAWETFISRELPAFVDSRYRTIAAREGRGIAGHSMGGFGALRVAMLHPDRFGAVYGLSPYGLAFDLPATRPAGAPDVRFVDPSRVMPDSARFRQARSLTNLALAAASALSPNLAAAPFPVDFPYRIDGDSLRLDEGVARRWRRTPLAMLPTLEARQRAAIGTLRVGLDAGRDDEYADIPVLTKQLADSLRVLRATPVLEIYEGRHSDRIRERMERVLLPFFSDAFAVPRSGKDDGR